MPDLMNAKTQIALKIVGMRGLPVHKTAFAQIEPTKSFTVIVVWLKTQVTRQLKQKPQMKVLQSLLLAVEPEDGGFQKGKNIRGWALIPKNAPQHLRQQKGLRASGLRIGNALKRCAYPKLLNTLYVLVAVVVNLQLQTIQGLHQHDVVLASFAVNAINHITLQAIQTRINAHNGPRFAETNMV